jgi:Protein of unknown function (DUF2946)
MDEAVARALTKWPDVPAVFGWLRLDQRGQWRLKDEIVRHAGLVAFLGRNYSVDVNGNWFVQNGPQKVFVILDYTPWVIRIGADSRLETHTGLPLTSLNAAMLDERGNLLLESEHGIGVATDRDLAALLDAMVDRAGQHAHEADLVDAIDGGAHSLKFRWGGHSIPLKTIESNGLTQRYRYVQKPSATAPDQSA